MKTHNKIAREPFLRIIKRETMPVWQAMLIRVIAVVAGILLCAGLSVMVLDNVDFLKFIKTLFSGAIGTERNIWKLAKNAAVLLCISLAVTPAFRMKFWNIGAEGQTLIGCLASVAVAYYLGGKLPTPVLLLLMLLASVAAGAIWGALPAIFKAKWNTNETLFTLMMNYVATGLVAFCLAKWCPSNGSVLGALPHGHLPVILNEYLLLILVTLVLTAIVFVYLYYMIDMLQKKK